MANDSRKRRKLNTAITEAEQTSKELVKVAKALALDPTPDLNCQFMALIVKLLQDDNEIPYKAGIEIQKAESLFSPHDIPYSAICTSFSSDGKRLTATKKGADLATRPDPFLRNFVFERFDLVQAALKPFASGSEPENEAHLEWLLKNVLQVITSNIAPGFLEIKPEHALNSSPAHKRGRVEILTRNTLGAAIGIVVEVKASLGPDFSKVLGHGLAEMAMVLAMNASQLVLLEVQYLVLVDRHQVKVIEVTFDRVATLVWSSDVDIWPAPSKLLPRYNDAPEASDFDTWRPIANAFAAMAIRMIEVTCSAFASRSQFRHRQDPEEDSDGTISSASPLSNFGANPEELPSIWAGELRTAQDAHRSASHKNRRWQDYYAQCREAGQLLPGQPSSDSGGVPTSPSSSTSPHKKKGRKSEEAWSQAAQHYKSLRTEAKDITQSRHVELHAGFEAIPRSAKMGWGVINTKKTDRERTPSAEKGAVPSIEVKGSDGRQLRAAGRKRRADSGHDGTATSTRNAIAGPSGQR